MKQIFIFIAIFLISQPAAAQKNKHKKDKLNGTFNTYTSIIIDNKEEKNPTRLQAIQCMINYLNNNWLETSNIYRSEHIHTTININLKKITLNNI